MNNKPYKKIKNKNGYTLFLILIVFLMLVFWQMSGRTFEIITFLNLQKNEMTSSGIIPDSTDIPAFELE